MNGKITALRRTNMSAKHFIKCYESQKWILKNSCANKFSRTQFQFVSIFFKFVRSLLLSYLLCYLYFFSCVEQFFTQFGGGCHGWNFHELCDTAPLKYKTWNVNIKETKERLSITFMANSKHGTGVEKFSTWEMSRQKQFKTALIHRTGMNLLIFE